MKTYQVNDLFFDNWKDLSVQVHTIVFALQQEIKTISPGDKRYGYALISILRHLRKPGLKRLQIDKLSVEQIVDIYNDLKFLNEPWYHFPAIENKALALIPPDDHMARHTFDHFIYADNEFSFYMITKDPRYLRRLLVTIYRLPGEEYFDKESVEDRARFIDKKVNDYQLLNVFYTYAQVREYVNTRCKTLIPKPVKVQSTEPVDEDPPTPTGAQWLKLKHRLAETPVFQGFDTAGRSNMYASLDYLEDLAQQKQNAKS